jgi:hypothetical protein
MRRIFVAALLRLLLPDLSLAQPNQAGAQGGQDAKAAHHQDQQTVKRRQQAGPARAGHRVSHGRHGEGLSGGLRRRGRRTRAVRRGLASQCLRAATSSGIGADISPASVAHFRYPPGWGYRRWTVRRVLLAPNVRPGREHGCNCASAAQLGAVVSSVVARTCAALCGAPPLTEHGSNPLGPDPTRSSHPRDANPIVVTGRPALLGHAPIRT